MRYFDSLETEIGVKHIMASGALPPAFPAVRIDGELYWDGGILSNTPAEVIFDDNPRKNSLVFAVHMWNPVGPEPETIWEVTAPPEEHPILEPRREHIARQAQTHRLRHVIKELSSIFPRGPNARGRARVDRLGCLTRMHVVRLLAPRHRKRGPHQGRRLHVVGHQEALAGWLRQTSKRSSRRRGKREVDPLEGVFLHEPQDTVALEEMATSDALPSQIAFGQKSP